MRTNKQRKAQQTKHVAWNTLPGASTRQKQPKMAYRMEYHTWGDYETEEAAQAFIDGFEEALASCSNDNWVKEPKIVRAEVLTIPGIGYSAQVAFHTGEHE